MKATSQLKKPVLRPWLVRGLLLFGLFSVVLFEMWGVVLTKQALRTTTAEYAHTLQAQRQAQTQWSRLVLEYSHLKAPLALEKAAKKRLNMTYKPPEQIITIYED